MPFAADPDHTRQALETRGTRHELHGVWVKRRSLVIGASPSTVDPTDGELIATDLPVMDLESETEASDSPETPPTHPDPLNAAMSGTPLLAGLERELRTLRAAISDLRREVRALHTNREDPG